MRESKSNTNILAPVFAIKIKAITPVDGGFAVITPDDGQAVTDLISITADFVEKHHPQPGGYYIMCEGGVSLYSEQ
ncbi:hypothetical protein [Serratia fonticola]|uniref:hypothetical protein n=1 Tax=Serratia fonticola TaxID=47917 RepID=UPI001378B2B4|nr:hypothetical protein [Serratia fonticola]NCG50533.1 hypothetical protein [Serratia fonticola]